MLGESMENMFYFEFEKQKELGAEPVLKLCN